MSYVAGWLYRHEDKGDGYESGHLIKHNVPGERLFDDSNLATHLKVGFELIRDVGWAYVIRRVKPEPRKARF